MSDLRVAVLGVGLMGTDHVERLSSRISGARVVVVNDFLTDKAEAVAAGIPGCRAVGDPLDAIAEELDDEAIERSIAEINEAIRRSAARKA